MQAIQGLNAVATMKAVVHREYGAPEALTVGEVSRPAPGADDLLIRVVAAGASIGDHHIVTGKPYLVRLSPFGGFPRPKHLVPGAAMAGRVEAVGANVKNFRVGDEVFGQALNGAFAEYLVMPAALVAPKPKNLTFEQAAAVPWGTTALQALRDAGELKRRDRS
jgi:NADPH:quinone reductase-like Zn-dependent oxidoreductase